MDALLNEQERAWRDRAIGFARSELGEDPSERDRGGSFWRAGYERCGQAGFLGLPIPAEFGGQGLSVAETVAAMEGLGYACPDTGLIFAISASLWTVTMPILEFGTELQKQAWLPGLCDGRVVGCNAASEPEAGSDIFSLKTTARRDGSSWVLDGRKIWITAAPVADLLLVFASTDPERGALGISCFLIPKGTPGLSVVRSIPKMGLRSAPMGEIVFESCRLPTDALLGREGRGARIFQAALEYERGAILAPVLGTMRKQLETCLDYARKRKQFGQPIGKFQAVSHRLVEMAMRLESARPFVYAFARARAQRKDAALEASMAKVQVSECFVQNSLDAVRTFGGLGYAVETGIERDLRDSVGGVIFSGTNDIQKNIIAQHLKL
jgi:alkylation response protein AidB-like acyl-CoA dehydrogenase